MVIEKLMTLDDSYEVKEFRLSQITKTTNRLNMSLELVKVD